MSEREVVWEIAMPGRPTQQFIPFVYFKEVSAENARLKAEVERLRKAGDAMADWMDELGAPRAVPFVQAWQAAKEGKQP
jgi:hypothetical protein